MWTAVLLAGFSCSDPVTQTSPFGTGESGLAGAAGAPGSGGSGGGVLSPSGGSSLGGAPLPGGGGVVPGTGGTSSGGFPSTGGVTGGSPSGGNATGGTSGGAPFTGGQSSVSGAGGSGGVLAGAPGGGGSPETGGMTSGGGADATAGGGAGGASTGGAISQDPVSFQTITQIMTRNCTVSSCHRPGRNPSFTNASTLHNTLMTFNEAACNTPLVTPGDPDRSAVLSIVEGECGLFRMPPTCFDAPCIPVDDIQTFTAWVLQGALRD